MAKLVNDICKKTKMKRLDVVDVLEQLPKSMVEVFFEEKPAANQPVTFGFLSMSWGDSSNFGKRIYLKKSPGFQKTLQYSKEKHNGSEANT